MKFADKFCEKRPPLRQALGNEISLRCSANLGSHPGRLENTNDAASIDIPEINRDKQ